MKRREKRIYYIVFFCVIVVLALHSLEGVMQLEEGGLLEEINRPITRKGFTNEATKTISIQESSKEEAQSRPIEEFIPKPSEEDLNVTSPYVEEKKEANEGASPGVEKTSASVTSNENTKKDKTKKEEETEETEFSSIQSNGLTLANGASWYFEEYDEAGNVVSTASYNGKKLVSKSQFEYNEEGKKVSATLTEPKKIIKLTFDDKGVEIGRTEYKKRKGAIGDVYSSHQKNYDNEGRLKEEITSENGITTKKVYTYNDKKLATETIFENDMKTLFIEYREESKIVHIFDGDVELSVFEEALEWKVIGFFLC